MSRRHCGAAEAVGRVTDATYEFGWRKYRFRVPEPWEPGKFEGDDVRGYVRLDDSLMTRLELKWDSAYRAGACDAALELYLRELQKAGKGRKGAPGLRREPKEFSLVSSWPEGMTGRAVRWSAEVDCVALFVACERCHRLSALQVLFPAGEMDMGLARQVAASLRDHVDDPDGPALWSLYRMRVQVPGRWRLREHRFGPGFAALAFAGPDRLTADIRRAGPAEILLKKTDLAGWHGSQLPRGIKVDPARVERTEVRGDTVLTCTLEPRGLLAALRRRAKTEVALRAMAMESTAWHCPSSNRLWAVTVFAPTLPEAREAEWQVFCHEG